MIKSIIWSSLIDYPDCICSTIFCGGCNFNCEYCYSKKLNNKKDLNFYNEILPKLLERKKFINHIVLSGGECTVSLLFIEIVNCLYESNFNIGIHTNGYATEIIEKVINKLSYIGMDIKNDFDNYNLITRSKY